MGRLVFYKNISQKSFIVNITNQKSGAYFISIDGDVYKIVKE